MCKIYIVFNLLDEFMNDQFKSKSYMNQFLVCVLSTFCLTTDLIFEAVNTDYSQSNYCKFDSIRDI